MKIGIVTLWGCANYGQNLQVYALRRFLQNAGHDAYLIRYPLIEYKDNRPAGLFTLARSFIKQRVPKSLLYFLDGLRNKKSIVSLLQGRGQKNDLIYYKSKTPSFTFYRDPAYLIHLRAIGQFLDTHIKQSELFYPSIAELKAFPPEADVYITGSDQVWNFWGKPFDLAKNETLDAFFLNFGPPETKRVAYAASFGTRIIDKESVKIAKPLINKFSYVSVREETGLDLCGSCGYNNAEWVPDPTLLLDMEHYRSLYSMSQPTIPESPFCLVYTIRDNHVFLDRVYSWAKEKKLDVVLITNSGLINPRYRETFATIPDWLCLIDNAEYVITDSYHGSIFSLIFKKPFGIIPFRGCETDIRLNDLFKRFELRFPLLDNGFSSFVKNTELEKSTVIMHTIYKKYSLEWFNKILSL